MNRLHLYKELEQTAACSSTKLVGQQLVSVMAVFLLSKSGALLYRPWLKRCCRSLCAHVLKNCTCGQYSTESLPCACSPIYIFNANPYCHEELVWHRVSRKDCAPQQSTPSRPALHQMRLSEGNAVVCVSQSQPLELSPLGLQKTLHRLCALHSGSVSRTRQARLNCSCYFACFKVDGCGCN